MEITRLRVSGFKSFSEPVELLLEPGLTGIVGPNGCGKSNIVEALRWAMGESSAKGLRGDEMEDVIFNGAAGRPAHDVAEVRLKLRGRPEGLTGFDESGELEVSRKIGRGVGSTYRINGREARARDVQILFADAGAGSRSPAIIGQGQIGFIVDSRPIDRRRLLEDAAGIGGLQTRRREAELRLEATQANLQRVLDLLGTQETRLAELAKQAKQAQRYRKLAAELRSTEALVLLARHAAAAQAAASAESAVAEAAAEQELRAEAAASLRRARADTAARLPALRTAAAGQQAEAAALRERLASLRDAAGREAAQIAGLTRQREDADADLARAERSNLELGESLGALRAEHDALVRSHATLLERMDPLGEADGLAAAKLAAAQLALREILARTADATAQLDAARERLDDLRRRQDAIGRELLALPAVAQAQAAQDRAEADLCQHEAALSAARDRLAASENELAALGPARDAQRESHTEAERAVTLARQQVAVVEQQLRETQAASQRIAERRAAVQRGRDRLVERDAAHRVRADLLERGAAEADGAARGADLTSAEAELGAADEVLDTAREALAAAELERGQAAAGWRDLRRSADAVEAEIKVLASLAPETDAGGLLDRLDVPAELAAALAVALGDDLLAGTDPDAPRFWREILPTSLGDLPHGAQPLVELVGAPAVLHARLSQIGLAGADVATAAQAMLKPGQRLVSPDGGLWRWDGFVRAPGSEDGAAARVRHHLRLHVARDELAALATSLHEQEAAVTAGELALQAARLALGEAETRWRAADTAQLRARQRLDEAAALAERQAAEASRLAQEAAALTREASELAAEETEVVRAAGALADEAALAALIAGERAALTRVEAELAASGAEKNRLEAAHAAAMTLQRTSRATLEQTQAALEQARATALQAARHTGELEAERRAREAALAREGAEVAAALAAAEPATSAAVEAAELRLAERAEAERALAAAEAARQSAGDALAGARAEATALANREATVNRSCAEAELRHGEADGVLAELRERCQRLAAELAIALAERRSDPAALEQLERETTAADALSEATRADLAQQEAAWSQLERAAEAADGALGQLRERLAVAQSERGHAEEALAVAIAAVRDRLEQEPEALLEDEATRAALASDGIDELESRLARLRTARERLGPVNLRADVEAGELEAEVNETTTRQAELQQAVDRLRAAIATLDREARERLLAAFEAVDGHFRRLFGILFGGGKAHLRLTGMDDPLHAGLELEASPPGKKLSSISLLSGGEKTLTALALVFGFFLAQPSPLCVLDEVDAPLDDANVDRFVALMQEIAQATSTRFLCVTHHPLTMARMDRLYGVTMAERGVSRLVSVALERALELRATA